MAWECFVHQLGTAPITYTVETEAEARDWLDRKLVSHTEAGYVITPGVDGFRATKSREELPLQGLIKDRTISIRAL